MNIAAMGNSSIAFTDPVLGNYELLNLVATDSANTRLFTYSYRATGFNSSWLIDSIKYNDINKTIVWHEYSDGPLYDLFVVSQ